MAELDRRDEGRLPIVTRWLDLTAWLMKTTARFPKRWRPSLVSRVDEEALEVLLLLTEAAFVRRKLTLLRKVNVRLSRLRMLLEVSHRLEVLSPGALERATVAVDEVGRMLGGWIREVASREGRRDHQEP